MVSQFDSIISIVDKSYLKPKSDMNLFVKLGNYNHNTTFIFNYIENMPSPVQEQIGRSNRFLQLRSSKLIPILFDLDDGNSLIRELGVNHGIIGGYLLEVDNYGKVTISQFAQ